MIRSSAAILYFSVWCPIFSRRITTRIMIMSVVHSAIILLYD